MGAGASAKYAIEDFDPLQMENFDIEKLTNLFKKIDKENKSIITVHSMISSLQMQPTIFLNKLFSLPSNDGATLDLKTFVFFVWNYCTLLDFDLFLAFIYELYRKNGSRLLDSDEFLKMLREINQKTSIDNASPSISPPVPLSPLPSFPSASNEVIPFEDYSSPAKTSTATTCEADIPPEVVNEVSGKVVNLDNFRSLIRKYPSLLEPVSSFQQRLVSETLGQVVWTQYSRVRPSVCAYEYSAVVDFFNQHLAVKEDSVLNEVLKSAMKPRNSSFGMALRKASITAVSASAPTTPPSAPASVPEEGRPPAESARVEALGQGQLFAKRAAPSGSCGLQEAQPLADAGTTNAAESGKQSSVTETLSQAKGSLQGLLVTAESFFSKPPLHSAKPSTAATEDISTDSKGAAEVTVRKAHVKITRMSGSSSSSRSPSPSNPRSLVGGALAMLGGGGGGGVTVVDFHGSNPAGSEAIAKSEPPADSGADLTSSHNG